MFIHYQGDDARQSISMEGKTYSLLKGAHDGYYSKVSDKFKASQIKLLDKYMSQIYYVNPDLQSALPIRSKFIPYSNINLSDWAHPVMKLNKEKIRIVHAPSNRGIKGTNAIINAVNKICSENSDVEFSLIENLSHAEAKKIYADADLLIDQLLGGWYGGLAVEGLALGVPVMCFLGEEDLNLAPNFLAGEIPIINVTIQNLEQEIERFFLLSDSELSSLRNKCRKFVEKWHDADLIAKQIIDDYIISRN
jgi:glycosyltransferase involved in cell wall biosynthesis